MSARTPTADPGPRPDDLLRPDGKGLHCEAGGFHVDPWRPVPFAVVTHAHADHAAVGCERYLCTPATAAILRARFGVDAPIDELDYAASAVAPDDEHTRTLGDVRVSLHPAGHILGSAQVRIEHLRQGPHAGEVWVVTGDYKTLHAGDDDAADDHRLSTDHTCAPFAVVPCDVLITESTFGLPIYAWRPDRETFDDINAWWAANARANRCSVLYGYALGKAQRLLAGVDPSIGPILAHGSVRRLLGVYREFGVDLPDVLPADREHAAEHAADALVIAPPSTRGSTWIRKFAKAPGGATDAFASGWMALRGTRRRRNVERGFVLSDHCDWRGLLHTVRATGARRVGVTHGFASVVARYLREQMGLDAFTLDTRYEGEEGAEDAAEPHSTHDDAEAAA